MANLREAAELAIKALTIQTVIAPEKIYYTANPELVAEAAVALRQALAQSEWVGLGDDELRALCDEWQIIYGGYVRPFAETIEAKLKEKNT